MEAEENKRSEKEYIEEIGKVRNPFVAAPGGYCRCPNCKHQMPHNQEHKCGDIACPNCGHSMQIVKGQID